MKWMQLFAIAILGLLTVFCGNDQPDEVAEDMENQADTSVARASEYVNNLSDAVYAISRIENEVFYETGEPVRWDGRAINDARSLLSMSIGETCGRGDCGKQVYLTNSHESQSVRTVVTVPFQVGNSDDYLAREYIIAPGKKEFIGCTHLCDGEKKVDFKRAIVVSELVNEVQ